MAAEIVLKEFGILCFGKIDVVTLEFTFKGSFSLSDILIAAFLLEGRSLGVWRANGWNCAVYWLQESG